MPDPKTKFHPSAQSELNDALQHYETQVPGLGAEFLAEVRGSVSLISEFPEAGSLIWSTRRRVLVKHFPYALVYRILQDGTIRILAVMHLRRRPTYWRSRR